MRCKEALGTHFPEGNRQAPHSVARAVETEGNPCCAWRSFVEDVEFEWVLEDGCVFSRERRAVQSEGTGRAKHLA